MKHKQVRLLETTDNLLNKLVRDRQEKNPYQTITKQGVVADLIKNAANKELKGKE